jgi:hypothetical protein
MGNNQSAPPPPPNPAPPVPVVSLPVQRVPTLDGASGLHYSGRVYTNQFQGLSSDICKGATAKAEQIDDIMKNSVSTTSLPMDDSTQRISQSALQSYVEGLIASGVVPGQNADFDAQMKADSAFYTSVQAEYCFYEARYVAALTQFLSLVSQPQAADSKAVDTALTSTVNLNKRLNSLLEIMNYVSNSRAQKVNSRSPSIDEANKTLQKKIGILKSQQEYLTSSDVRIRTQEEMMRFSSEKSRAMNIQIMFFVALNVVALGTIFTVYKSV